MATQDECAVHIDISRRTFIDYVNRGIITSAPIGEYDVDTVRSEYLRHLRGRVGEGEQVMQTPEREPDEMRRARALADKAEHEASEMRAGLVPAVQCYPALKAVLRTVEEAFKGVPRQIARRLKSRDTKAAEEQCRDAIAEALEPLRRMVADMKALRDR